MLVFRRCMVALAAVAAALPAMGGIARADDAGVKAAIVRADRTLAHTPQLAKFEKGLKLNTPAKANKAIKELQPVVRKLRRVANDVAKTSASTAAGATGRRDWLAGTRDLARGLSQLVVSLRDIANGDKTAAKAEALKSLKTVVAGAKLDLKADKALGLPKGA